MNDPNMVEIIVAVPANDTVHILPCVHEIVSNTQRSFRLTVALYGFIKEAGIAAINAMLATETGEDPWTLVNDRGADQAQIVHECLKKSEAEYQIVVPYDVRIQDDAWFGKMQQPLLSVAASSFCNGMQNKSTLPPVRMSKMYSDGTSMFMTNRKALKAVLGGVQPFQMDYARCYFDALMRSGLFAFYIPSVGTHRVEIGRKGRTSQGSRS